MTSIRRRTSVLVAATLAVMLAVGGVVLFIVVRAALTRQFDDGLLSRAAALQSLVHVNERGIDFDISGEALPRYQPDVDAEVFIAWIQEHGSWRLLERSESLNEAAAQQWATDRDPQPGFEDVTLPDRRRGRAFTVEFIPTREMDGEEDHETRGEVLVPTPGSGDESAQVIPAIRLLVAQSRQPLDQSLTTIGASIIGVGVLLVLAGVFATSWAVRRGTQPLASLSHEVASIGPATLDRRIATDSLPAELAAVGQCLNDLLQRLDDAFARERRFTSAASHELRTPIAELRMLLEVALSRPRAAADWERTGREGLDVLERAQRLCESLLRLSRVSVAGDGEPAHSTADLSEIVRDQVARAIDRHAAERAWIQIDAPPSVHASTETTVAASIISNLLDNALRHGRIDAEHPVRCSVVIDASTAVVTISNAAHDLNAEDVDRLFEPFWQKDASRQEGGGFGLGLAVCRALVEASGGKIEAVFKDGLLAVTWRVPTAT